MKSLLTGLLTLSVITAGSASGIILVNFDLTGAPGDQAFSLPTTVAAGATSSALTRGSGFTASDFGDNSFAGYRTNGASASFDELSEMIAAQSFFSFTVSPEVGTTLDLDQVSARVGSQNRVRDFYLLSSVGGFTAGASLGMLGTQEDATFSVNLGTAFDSLSSPVEFRIYAVNSTDGAWGYESVLVSGANAITVSGVSVVPEPSTYAGLAGLLGLGAVLYRRRKQL